MFYSTEGSNISTEIGSVLKELIVSVSSHKGLILDKLWGCIYKYNLNGRYGH